MMNGAGGNDNLSLNEASGVLPLAALFGGDGNDTLTGGSGDDLIEGGAGTHACRGTFRRTQQCPR
jgi:Ca2+-binding RTX toxin-like protein